MPVEESIEATAGVLLLHMPPDVVLLSAKGTPIHIYVPPVMAAGNGFTVTEVATEHPEGMV